MADKPIPIKPVSDAGDFDDLWIDTGLSDGIVTPTVGSVPVDKPKTFFRVHPDIKFRRHTEIYAHKPEGAIGTQYYVVAKPMRGLIKARPCVLVCCIYRDGSPRLWPISFPRQGEHDNEAWVSARSAAKVAIDQWIRIDWNGRAYDWRPAQPGYAPDPDWKALPPWKELVKRGLGEHGIIRNEMHPIYREYIGVPMKPKDSDGLADSITDAADDEAAEG
jgi:hypothetical protein